MVLLRIFASLLVLCAMQPTMAHGPDRHDSDTEPATMAPVDPDLQGGAGAVVEAQSDTTVAPHAEGHHAAASHSLWTRLHPASVHFPIALIIGAALAELLAMLRASDRLAQAAHVMAWGGAGGAVLAALLGWAHTGVWLGGDATMQWHRWTGSALAVVAPIAALAAGRTDRRVFRILLLLMSVALLAQGYWGGELAHGPNHLGL